MESTEIESGHDPPVRWRFDSELGLEAVEIALIAAIMVALIVGAFPLLADAVGIRLDLITNLLGGVLDS